MGEYLSVTDRLTAPRQMRFPDHFLDDIQALVNMLIKDIIDRYIKVTTCCFVDVAWNWLFCVYWLIVQNVSYNLLFLTIFETHCVHV